MGTARLETGDYKWRDDMESDLSKTIESECAIWVTATPPASYDTYDTSKSADLAFWKVRRENGLKWTYSSQGCEFAKTVYRAYADIFANVTEDQGRSTFNQCFWSNFTSENVVRNKQVRRIASAPASATRTPLHVMWMHY